MSVIGSNILAGASGQGGGYNLTKSLRFRSSASASLSRTPASATNRKTWTWSAWIKRAEISDTERVFFSAGTDGNNFTALEWISSKLYLQNYTSGTQTITNTTAVYRDASAWYHIVFAIDTTQATSANRAKVYVNGVQQDGFSGSPFSLNQEFWINFTYGHRIGARQLSSADAFSEQYMTEINFVDGQALTPSSFGETSTTTGVWIPKKYTGTYGTNGFYLPFTDTTSTSTLGTDFSGNSNTWTVNNISLTSGTTYDSMNDVPTLTSATAANFCVLNPLARGTVATGTITGGNLNLSTTTSDTRTYGSFGFPSSGKYYYELTNNNSGDKGQGIASVDSNGDTYQVLYFNTGDKRVDGTTSAYGASYTTNDVIGVAVDVDNNQITFYKNGTSQGAISYTFSSKPTMFPFVRREASTDASYSFNFGQRPFAYTPPTGFVALNTFNLPTPTIGATASTQANDYFDVSLYTGNGSNPRAITGLGFQPDFVWLKNRSAGWGHRLSNAVVGANYALETNNTNAELFQNQYGYLTSFNSDGFTVTAGSTDDYYTNNSGDAYVAWNWKANGSGSTNTVGSITSTVSANTTAGFSIVTYTGTGSNATVGHGLGVAPSMVIIKSRVNAYNWVVYNSSIGNTKKLYLDLTDGAVTDSTAWNNTSPTSSTFSLGSNVGVNQSSSNYVAYCFAQVAGYSAFGSYTGNGSTDGVFVFTGFRPRFIMIKRSDSSDDWIMMDSSRSTYNVAILTLYANGSFAEDSNVTNRAEDFLSNGFKIRSSPSYLNASGGTYIYMAFAESPFKYSLGR